MLLALSAPGARAADSPEVLAEKIRATELAFPGFLNVVPGERFLDGVNEAKLAPLLAAIARGEWDPKAGVALEVAIEGLSRSQGPAATYGRGLMSEVAGRAAASGSREALRGVTELLHHFFDDLGHEYSLTAQNLLSEKVRCGAASVGDDELVKRISLATNPDREWNVTHTDGTVADRFGLHARADLFGVAARGAEVTAVGYFGTALVSHDAGATWDAPATGTDEPLFAVAFGPGDERWVAGRAGTLLHSADAGRSFTRRSTPFERHIFGLLSSAPGHVLAVGDFGLQLETRDGGAHWTCIPREEDVILGRLSAAGSDAVVVGEFGTIERLPGRRPPGARGALTGVPDDVYVFDAWLDLDGKRGIAVGLEGVVLRTEDGGAHWSRIATGFTHDLFGVSGSGERVVVVGQAGAIAVSSDGGFTFAPASAPALPVSLTDVEFAGDARVYAVGPRGLVLASDDGGASFAVIRTGSGS